MKHFHGHNILVSVFHGLCEEVNQHHHASFLYIYCDQDNEEFWMVIEIFSINEEDHNHYYNLTEENMTKFFETGELEIISSSEDSDHNHTFVFNKENIQEDVLDVFGELEEESDDDEDSDEISA
jgi:hypothetical protein